MDSPRASFGRRVATLIIVLAVLAIYSYPYLATSSTLQSRQAPYSFAADLSLYLNLAQLGSSHLNPYYGTPMQQGGFGYLTFNVAFKLFGWLENIVHHNLWYTVLVWNWLWLVAIYIGAIWFFRLTLPEDMRPVAWMGTCILFFFNFGVLKSLLLAWLHLPSLTGFRALSLPYIRNFFPQIPVALLLFYLALQICALRFPKWYAWAGMCALQVVGFAMFPYAMLMMAGSTFVVAMACVRSVLPFDRLKAISLYGLACAAIDFLFLMIRLPAGTHDSQFSFISFRPSHIFDLIGGGLILLILLSLLIMMVPPVGSREAKWSLVGLGFSNVSLMLADVVAAPSLFISPHGAYFLHCTISLLVTYLLTWGFMRFAPALVWMRPACLTAIFLLVINGALLASGNYRNFLPQNRELGSLAEAVSSLQLNDNGLIVARADTVDDLCSWIPLLNRGTVLFCRSAQYELSDSERRGFHRLRQAFYLYFTGKDASWVQGVMADPTALTAQDRLTFAGEVNAADKEVLEKGKHEVTAELIPRFTQVEQRQDQVQGFFLAHPRVLVIDDAKRQLFSRERIEAYLSIISEQKVGHFVMLWCTPKPLHHEVEVPPQATLFGRFGLKSTKSDGEK
jgi:hypothetical protein